MRNTFLGCSEKINPENEWKLVWEDQFETDGKPNPEKWHFAGRRSPDWACYCTDDTATAVVSDGKLILTGKFQKIPMTQPATTQDASTQKVCFLSNTEKSKSKPK